MARSVTTTYTTGLQLVPDGVRYTQYQVSLMGATPVSQFMPFGTLTAVFPAVMPGTYVARVELSNANGSALGPGVTSASFEVPSDDAMLEVPQSLQVTVGGMTP